MSEIDRLETLLAYAGVDLKELARLARLRRKVLANT